MITELLILFILMNQDCTIYKIRKNINKYFFLFHSASMGTIYPVIQKLHSNGYIGVKKHTSPGGQKSSVYSIKNHGKKYFEKLMLQEIPENYSFSDQLAGVKILLLPNLNVYEKKITILNVKDYYKNKILDFESFQENYKNDSESEIKNLNINYVQKLINDLSEEINFLNTYYSSI